MQMPCEWGEKHPLQQPSAWGEEGAPRQFATEVGVLMVGRMSVMARLVSQRDRFNKLLQPTNATSSRNRLFVCVSHIH